MESTHSFPLTGQFNERDSLHRPDRHGCWISRSTRRERPRGPVRAVAKGIHDCRRGISQKETDLQRFQAVQRFTEQPQEFVHLAENCGEERVVLSALRQAIQAVISVDSQVQYCWEMNRGEFPVGMSGELSGRIVDILMRDHLESNEVEPICDRMRYAIRPEFEKFLDAAFESNPNRSVRGLSCLALAQLLRNQLNVADRVVTRPEWIARYDAILGKEYFAEIRGPGRAALEARIESLYERAAQFDDVQNFKSPETVAEKATAELFDIRHLSIGKKAPDIDGEDQDGRQFKLSE